MQGCQPPVLFVTLLSGSVGLSLHLLWNSEPNSGCRSCFRQSRILSIRMPFVFKNTYPPERARNTLRVVSRLYFPFFGISSPGHGEKEGCIGTICKF